MHLVARHGPVLLQALGVLLLLTAAIAAAKRHRTVILLLVASLMPLVGLTPQPALAHNDFQWNDYWAWPQSGSRLDGGNDQCTLGTSIQDHDQTTVITWAYGPQWGQKFSEPCLVHRSLPQHWIAVTARWWVNGNGNGGGWVCGWIDWWFSDRATDRYGLTVGGMPGCGPGFVSTDMWNYTTVNGWADAAGSRGNGRFNITNHTY
jgi:hypothetical protein